MDTTKQINKNNIIENMKEEKIYKVRGGKKLFGEVEVPGAKNASLPALVAASLSDEEIKLKNVPLELNDVRLMIELLKSVGVKAEVQNESEITLNGSNWESAELEERKASKIRHSLLLLGASASWKKEVFLPIPGGCSIGSRKYDLHIESLKAIGNEVYEENEGLMLKPAESNNDIYIDFHYPTFGGTLNVLFASVKLEGVTTILNNAAKNPEVLDVINLLNKMGANISWTNETQLKIVGVYRLNSTTHNVMSDRVIASTLISAIGLTKGEGLIIGADVKFLIDEVEVWQKAGLTIEQKENGIFVKWTKKLNSISIETMPYPGFHTDIQPLHGVLMTLANGQATIKENILDGRFNYCNELNKMGANTSVLESDFLCVNGAKGQIAVINGVNELKSSENLIAPDIRGGAAIVVAALAAQGTSLISNIYQIERGYSHLPELLQRLNGEIVRENKQF